MIKRKDKVVSDLTGGIKQLFKANQIEWLQGHGKLLADRQVEFTPHKGKAKTLNADHVMLATGSRPIDIGAAPLDGDRIVDSAGAQEFQDVPKRLGVIGAGVIGLEMGSVWNRLGSKVVLLEAQDSFLSAVDAQVAREARKLFEKQGLEISSGVG
jgi:dihydrolipoamide dehydrogenase